MLAILEKLKNRGFWAGVATAVAGILASTLSAPEAMLNILQSLIGR